MTEQLDELAVLTSAAWPTLLLDASACVQLANPAAVNFFGAKVRGSALAGFWTNENGSDPAAFLERVASARSLSVPLKLRGTGITITPFQAGACLLERAGAKLFLLQLFPPALAGGAMRPEARGQSVEINLAQKQKLDCALQLTRTVALDFNNTLTAILGHATHLLATVEPAHPWRASLVEIERAAAHAAEVANQLSAFSSEQKDAYAQTTGNINILLRRTVALFQTPQHQALAWSLQLEPKIFTVNHDEAKMQQALVKILENAVQAVQTDGRITIQTRNLELTAPTQDRTAHLLPGTYVCLEIGDNGCGIEPAVLPRVFEPFFTTKYGHRGLGLAWVYGIVTNHGGGVALSSQLGQGATVRVYLPAVKKIVEEKIIGDHELDGRETILLVDDEEMVLTMSRMVLESRGYRVLSALNGEQALEIFADTPSLIDLMITDMVMPKMNGRELIEKVVVLSPATRIVCATACPRSVVLENQFDFLTKPFTAQQLLRKTREALLAQMV